LIPIGVLRTPPSSIFTNFWTVSLLKNAYISYYNMNSIQTTYMYRVTNYHSVEKVVIPMIRIIVHRFIARMDSYLVNTRLQSTISISNSQK
jgi:hypothetical protein